MERTQETQTGAGRTPGAFGRWIWVLIPALFVAVAALSSPGLSVVSAPPPLRQVLSFPFSALAALAVAYFSARSFSRFAVAPVLLLGNGALAFGLAGLLASLAFRSQDDNLAFTISAAGTALSGTCHILGATTTFTASRRIRRWGLWLSGSYTSIAAMVVLIWIATSRGVTPAFLMEASGVTSIHQTVLSVAMSTFAVASVLLYSRFLRGAAAFLRWYGLGLGLISVGLFAALIAPERLDTVAASVGRAAWHLGGAGMVVAALVAATDSGAWLSAVRIALNRSRDRFRALVEASAQIVWTADAAGRVVEDSPSWRAFTGQSYAQLRGFGWLDAVHPDDRAGIEALWSGSKDGGQPIETELRLAREDGSWHWTYLRAVPLDAQEGDPAAWVAMNIDINKRKKAERKAQESEERLRIAVRNAPFVLAQTDRELRYSWILGPHPDFDASSVLGKRDDEIEDSRSARMLTELKRRVIEQRQPLREQIRFDRSDGVRWYDFVLEPLYTEDGTISGVKSAALDVTNRVLVEDALRQAHSELERRVRDRTAELQVRADELARLTTQLTLAEDREQRRLAQALHDNLQQLLVGAKLRLDILGHDRKDLSEPVGGVRELIDEAISASRSLTAELSPPLLHEGGLVAGLERLVGWAKDKHGLTVDLRVEPGVVTEREDVTVLIVRSVRELLFNVVKHAEVNSASVELAVHDRRHLRITVADEGCGFDMARTGDPSGSVAKGFGILSIRERIQTLRGRLDVHSKPGEGSRFTLIVPCGSSVSPGFARGRDSGRGREAVDPAGGPQPKPRPVPHGGPIRVLLVDDHEVVRRGLASFLAGIADIEVVGEAATGVEAVNLAANHEPDIVLMDFSMPDMDGVDATRAIRRRMPGVQVIGLSMYEGSEYAQAMLDAGAAAYLSKSGEPKLLIDTIRAVCSPS